VKFVFWQNILSPHQCDFLSCLADNYDVTLIVMDKIDQHRKNQHWTSNYSKNIKIIVNPSYKAISQFITQQEVSTINCFSGFLSYKKISLAFLLSLYFSQRSFIISEAVENNSFKGKIKSTVKSYLMRFLKSRTSGIFAIGASGPNYFKKLGIDDKKIFPFGYFINKPRPFPKLITANKTILFVGRLIPLKGVINLLKVFLFLEKTSKFQLKIIGSGVLRNKISTFIKCNSIKAVEMIGDIPRSDVLKHIAEANVLVLPNIEDEGWGVVVNEALLSGTPVVCSQLTGANIIVRQGVQGETIAMPDDNALIKAITKAIEYDSDKIRKIAERQILPNIAVDYFIKQITMDELISPPWLQKDNE